MRIGFLGSLTLIFITLKLLSIITWSWWVVLLPIYIVPLALAIGALVALLLSLTGD